MLGRLADHLRRRVETVIEEVSERDTPHLAEIHRGSFVAGWSDGDFSRMLANEAYLCLVARRKGAAEKPPLAFILLRTAADEAEIITIATQKGARRNGAASNLLSSAIRKLQADRVKGLFLEVDEQNAAAISLYRKSGFIQVGERKGYYRSADDENNNNSTALVMRLDLG